MAAGRGVVVTEQLMAAETLSAVIDFSPERKALLWDATEKRPRDLWAYIYDDPTGGDLLYPPLQLTSVEGDEEGLVLGGVGILAELGSGGIGPTIVDREYVSGANKLSNASFDLDDLYWVRAADGSMWVIAVGSATNAGGLAADDTLEYDRKFPTRPGHAYRVLVAGVTGTGRMRVRTIYEGHFHPADLLVNGGFESGAGVGWAAATNLAIVASGARTGTYAMRVSPIPKPQLIPNSGFESGSTGWIVGAEMSVVSDPSEALNGSGVLRCEPIPYPQLLVNPSFEHATPGFSWTPSAIGDIAIIIGDPTNARAGNNVMRIGPITQHQVFTNADFGAGLTNWFESSTDAEPHLGIFAPEIGGGVDGNDGIITEGWSTAGRTGPEIIKYLRADKTAGGGVEAYDVASGEAYRAEAYVHGHPGTDGSAYISLMIPHPSVPAGDLWQKSEQIFAPPHDDNRWTILHVDITIPANRSLINALFEVHDHSLGYWSIDHFTLTRTRGNRDRTTGSLYTVEPNQSYRLTGFVRSAVTHQVGSMQLGVKLYGPGGATETVETDQGHTDFEWARVKVEFTPDDGYVSAEPFVGGMDIFGGPMWIDSMALHRTSNNIRQTTQAGVAVIPDQRYLLAADVRADQFVTRGTVSVGITFSAAGLPDVTEMVAQQDTENEWVRVTKEVTPPPGYGAGFVFVRSQDTEGGSFYIDNLTLTKMDNNADSSAGTAIAVTPERTYRWTQAVRSGTALQRGTVKLSVRCTRDGYPDVVFDSSPMEATAGDWKFIDFSFTPPSGYDEVIPSLVGIDVEGDYWYFDDGELRDTDTATMVFDTTADNPGLATVLVDSTAPAGAETVRVALVVEQGSSSWTVGSASLARTGVTPATAASIVADLLEHPQTGLPLAIEAGTITAPAVIPYDVVIQNRTNRDTLDYLCNVVADPQLEYRVLPTDPPTIDVGPASVVFSTHSPADALLPGDLDVEELSDPVTDIADRPTEVTVLGAELEKVSGGTFLVTATAQVPGTIRYDLNGNAIVRTKQVSDGTVDHVGYAQALADDLAAREAEPPLVLTAKLSGKDTRADSPPGDTVHAYHPESGVEDTDVTEVIEGQVVNPRAVRVLTRERAHGPGHRIVMRRPDGTEFPLTGVRWSEEDATVLTIGDRLADWQADPQGLSAGEQYRRDRASRPR